MGEIFAFACWMRLKAPTLARMGLCRGYMFRCFLDEWREMKHPQHSGDSP